MAAGLLTLSCTVENKISDKEILDSRPIEKLDVSYAVAGSAVSALEMQHYANIQEIEVVMNNDNLNWTLESDRAWCKVVPGVHKGSGKITLEIAANESFEPRETATLTFVAGEYRGFQMSVDQSAASFIVGQPYFLSPLDGTSISVNVTTQDGTVWDASGNEWLTAAMGESTSAEGLTKTVLTIDVAPNADVSRFGAVTLSAPGAEDDKVYFWQFGTDLTYDDGGSIFFGNDAPANLKLTAPAFMVKDVSGPAFANSSVKENGDGTSTVDITLQDNLSDCAEMRFVDITLLLNNLSASKVAIPTMTQDFLPANGLVTPKGLMLFATAVSEGGDTSTWEKDGVVRVLEDINMQEITGWNGIGTSQHPFSGTFDGNQKNINNISGTASGLFNYCKDATIKDVILGKGTSIYNKADFMGVGFLGGIVSYAENTKVTGCNFEGEIEYAGGSNDEGKLYVGGIIGLGDSDTSVKAGKMQGKVTVSSPSSPDVVCHLGGIAGLVKGSLTSSEVTGEVKFSSQLDSLLMGGVESYLPEDVDASGNTFSGKVTLGGNAKVACLGGLYGRIDSDRTFNFSTDASVSMGAINIDSYLNNNTETHIYAGGFVGKIQPGVELKASGYDIQTGFHLDMSKNLTVKYICMGGFLGSCDPYEPAGKLTLEDISSSGAVTILYSATSTIGSRIRHGHFGGIVGYINGPGSITGCLNTGAIGAVDPEGNARCAAASNDYNEIIGGIIGCAKGGSLTIESCTNNAPITNLHYSNRPSTSVYDGMFSSQVAGGIIGAFSYFEADAKASLTIQSCVNSDRGQVLCFRGYSGGIVGYCQNATITDCSSSGSQAAATNDNAYYRGGIAAGVRKSTIKDCWAKCSISSGSGGSAEAAFSGGIVGWVKSTDITEEEPKDVTVIEGCKFYGILKAQTGSKPDYPGGILAAGEDNTVVKDCQFGGKIQDVDISNGNIQSHVIGNGKGKVDGISYWNGTL